MKYLIPILAMSLLLLPGCSKKDVTPPVYDSLGLINKWILDSMKRYYYWGDAISAKPESMGPDAFFKSILSVNDRFSWISNGLDIAPTSNSYFTYGFHYALMQVTGYDGLVGVVTAVNVGGSANMRGIKRGDYFLAVNGRKLTAQNIDEINLQLKTPNYVKITQGVYENDEWRSGDEITLLAAYGAEDPVHITRTFSAGGVVTGYLYYSSFDENYDDRLLQAISKLKQAGITELVLDLRYNAGGSVASSAKLACLIAKRLTGSETYVVFAGNHFEGRRGRQLQSVLNVSGNAAGRQYDALKSSQLSLNRVFILTTRATVSAAELTVNNLKPFLQVIQIGETTRGKNEAGFVIEDMRNPPQVAWSMEPTVYKLFNKNNEGNYENGLVPQYPISELAHLPLADIGTPDDPLLKKALELIYGAQMPGDYTNLGIRQRLRLIDARPVYQSTEDLVNSPLMRVKRIP